MKTSSVYLLIGIIIFVIGSFAWQYVMHLQLKEEPLSCTGELYLSNTCPLGQGCYYDPNVQAQTNNANPELNSAVQTIVDFQTGARVKPGVGTCQPWLNLLFNLNLPQTDK